MELEDRLTLAGAEGVDLDLALAGVGSRAAALFVDVILQALVALLVLLLASAIGGGPGLAVFSIGSFLIVFGYPTLAEALVDGQTLGKRLFSIAVVRTDGTPVRFLGAVIRNVLRVIDLLPGPYFVGLVAVLSTKRSQRIGDLAAGTLVIHRSRAAAGAGAGSGLGPAWWTLPVANLPPGADRWDVSMVSAEELAAVRAFLDRRGQLSPLHRGQLAVTLADQLRPKVAGVPTEHGPEWFLEAVAAVKTARS